MDRYFHWKGPIPSSPEERRAIVEVWLAERVLVYRHVATALVARLQPLLLAYTLRTRRAGHERFFYRLDLDHITKTPASILEKMAREWKDPSAPPPYNFDNLEDFKDLGRFRIVGNFLSDVKAFRQLLEAPFDARRNLSNDEASLRNEFSLDKNHFTDLIDLEPGARTSGERCFKGYFHPRAPEHSPYRVEVQIMTSFADAWDKKEHWLIYEHQRTGKPVDFGHKQEVHAISETLHLADRTLDRIKIEVERSHSRRTGRHHALAP